MTYEQAKQEFESIYGVNPTAWDTCYSTPGKPLSAYTIFKTYEGANTFIHGQYDDEDEIYTYDAYVGAVIAVVKDTSVNNGLYQVVLDSSVNPTTYENKYKLVKMLSEEDNIGGQITVLLKNVLQLDEQHPGLVHLASALVGPPHSRLLRARECE